MNIDPRHAPQQGTPTIAGRSSAAVPRVEPDRVPPPGGRPADRVEISADAQTFQRLRARLEAVDEGRAGRVAALRDAFAAGVYAPAGEQIAGALLADESLAALLGAGGVR